MFRKILLTLLTLMLFGGSLAQAAPAAQSGNLVTNSGFEATGGDTGAANWAPWWSEQAKPADGSFNYAFKPNWNVDSLNKNDAKENIYAGVNTQRTINSWDPWFGGMKQVVVAPAGARVRLTAFGKLWASPNPWPAPADTSATAKMYVGLEPNGDSNQFLPSVVWSGIMSPYGTWQSVSVEATVGASGKVTVILAGDYRGTSRQFMAGWWDEVSLTVVGASTGNTAAPGATSAPAATSAPVLLTPFTIPTAGSDGNIVYVVQAGDTLWRIAGLMGTTPDQIKAMNGLTSDIISTGQRLIIGKSAAAATAVPPTPEPPTAAPSATTAPEAGGGNPNPTAAPEAVGTQIASADSATVCAMMFEDLNGNGKRDANEGLVSGGQFTVVDTATGAPLQSYTTDGVNEPHCFANLAPGEYTVSSAAPQGYNPTTSGAIPLPRLEAGAYSNTEFGAQPSANASDSPTTTSGNSRLRIALFGAAGIMFLLLAAGVAAFLILRQQK